MWKREWRENGGHRKEENTAACHWASSTFEDSFHSNDDWWSMFPCRYSCLATSLIWKLLVSYSVFKMLTLSKNFIHLSTLYNILDYIQNAIIKTASYMITLNLFICFIGMWLEKRLLQEVQLHSQLTFIYMASRWSTETQSLAPNKRGIF